MKIDHEPIIYDDLEIISRLPIFPILAYYVVFLVVAQGTLGGIPISRRMYCFTAQILTNVYDATEKALYLVLRRSLCCTKATSRDWGWPCRYNMP